MSERAQVEGIQIYLPTLAPRGLLKPKYKYATKREAFEHFHALNPHVLEYLRELALNMKKAGFKRYGIQGLFNIFRYDPRTQTTGGEYKISNSFSPYYARALMSTTPALVGFFVIGKLKEDK